MTLILSGTDGLSDIDGSAATPAIRGTDTNTGIFFPAADTIAFSEGGVEVMRLDSSANLQFNSGYGSVATAYACRAWVNFNGTGTVAIRASGNVTSITDNGVGLYTVNFTTAMPDINYSSVVSASPIYAAGSSFVNLYSNSATTEVAPTTSAFTLRCGYTTSGTTDDLKYICIAVFR
jgi:hypothetical protein